MRIQCSSCGSLNCDGDISLHSNLNCKCVLTEPRLPSPNNQLFHGGKLAESQSREGENEPQIHDTHLSGNLCHSTQWDSFPSKHAWVCKDLFSGRMRDLGFPFPAQFGLAFAVAGSRVLSVHMTEKHGSFPSLLLEEEWDLPVQILLEGRRRVTEGVYKGKQNHTYKMMSTLGQVERQGILDMCLWFSGYAELVIPWGRADMHMCVRVDGWYVHSK